MSNSSENKNPLDLSALDFGPSWARDKGEKKNYKKFERSEDRSSKGKKKFTDRRKFNNGDQYSERPQRRVPREALPEGVKASIMPVESGIDNLAKQIAATGRTYSVFDLARVILKSRDRYNIAFQVDKDSDLSLYQSKGDGATFLSKEEALAHFSQSERVKEFYKSVEVEVDAPSGNFPTIACCGFTGEPIAPPNYHGYQEIVIQRHSADFSNMSLENYRRRIKSERDEEKVQAWLESMKKQTKYQFAENEEVEFSTKKEALDHFSANVFSQEFEILKRAFVKSDVAFSIISSGLASGLLEVISEQNKYPGELSSFLCRQLSGRHLAVYKWQGKLHAGPSRPHAVPEDTKIADRPMAMFKWAQENSGAGIDELWQSVFPENVTEAQKAEWYHDLHWMLNQGYFVLLESGQLNLSSDSKKKGGQRKQAKSAVKSAKKQINSEAKEVSKAKKDGKSQTDRKIGEEAKTEEPKVEENGAEKTEEVSKEKLQSLDEVSAEKSSEAESTSKVVPEDDVPAVDETTPDAKDLSDKEG